MQNTDAWLRGFYRDVLTDSDRDLVYDSGWQSNTIVVSCRVLLAGFMRNEPGKLPVGITHMAVGRGRDAWDAQGIPPVDPADTKALENPVSEDPIEPPKLTLAYLDISDRESMVPTNRLQVTATLDPMYPVPPSGADAYPLREFGLFGRFGETNVMINCIRHPVIHKGPLSTLIRRVHLYF